MFTGITNTKNAKEVDLFDVLQDIKSGKWKSQVEKYRLSKATYDKSALPNITVSGLFNERKKSEIKSPTGYICVDIDYKGENKNFDFNKLKKDISQNIYVVSCFYSAGGEGLAVIFYYGKENYMLHEKIYRQISNDIFKQYNVIADEACKDISRVRYISYDPEIYINNNALKYRIVEIDKSDEFIKRKLEDMISIAPDGEKHNILLKASRLAGGYIAAGEISEFEAISILENAIKSRKIDDFYGAKKTIIDGIKYGQQSPIQLQKTNYKELQPVYQEKESVQAKPTKSKRPSLSEIESFLKLKFNLKRNQVTQVVEYIEDGMDNYEPIVLENIWRECNLHGYDVGIEKIRSILNSNFVESYNPFYQYFISLHDWDGVDYIKELASYIHTDNDVFFQQQLTKCLVRCIACSLDNKENRIVFTLFSQKQENGKSTFVRFLNPFPNLKYYVETPLRDGKDDYIRLAENFIYNIEELSTMDKKGVDNLKAIISTKSIKERKAFRSDDSQQPRRCNFFATTNNDDFLLDSENTRWLIFEIKSIDFNYSKNVNINNVWAQAYALYMDNFDYQLTDEEKKIRNINNHKYSQDMIEEALFFKIFNFSGENFVEKVELTSSEILLELKQHTNSPLFQQNLSKVLKKHGQKATIKKIGNSTKRVYTVFRVNRVTNSPFNTIDIKDVVF